MHRRYVGNQGVEEAVRFMGDKPDHLVGVGGSDYFCTAGHEHVDLPVGRVCLKLVFPLVTACFGVLTGDTREGLIKVVAPCELFHAQSTLLLNGGPGHIGAGTAQWAGELIDQGVMLALRHLVSPHRNSLTIALGGSIIEEALIVKPTPFAGPT
jgi:hypothetical protein